MYRSVPHVGTGETPAFALFGADLRPARVKDWRSVPYPNESDRLKFLLETRKEIATRAISRAMQMKARYDTERRATQFHEGDLVLIRKPPKDKLTPNWSFPYRVISVDRKGTTATVRHLFFEKVKSGVHVSNCRFIKEPLAEQQAGWKELVRYELEAAPTRARKRALSAATEKPRKTVGLTVGGENDTPVLGTAPPPEEAASLDEDPVETWWYDE
jgi:hypothetical protein